MVIQLLKESNALLEGHFLLSSGKHSDGYVQCARLLQHPDKAEKALKRVVDQLDKEKIDIVLGPAMGGIVVAYELGRQLGKPAIFSERENGEMTLRRGFEIRKGDRVLIAEDVVTTGKSAFEAIDVVERYGGEVVGIACLVNRTGKNELKYPLYPATALDINVYDGDACPLCEKGMEIVKPGSRKFNKD